MKRKRAQPGLEAGEELRVQDSLQEDLPAEMGLNKANVFRRRGYIFLASIKEN